MLVILVISGASAHSLVFELLRLRTTTLSVFRFTSQGMEVFGCSPRSSCMFHQNILMPLLETICMFCFNDAHLHPNFLSAYINYLMSFTNIHFSHYATLLHENEPM